MKKSWSMYWMLWVIFFLAGACSVSANVYATNIKFDGQAHNLLSRVGRSIRITFTLNDHSNGGTAIVIQSGTNVIRTITIENGAHGTWRGENSVIWDGKDENGNDAGPGVYSVAITTAHQGFPIWTRISEDESNDEYKIFEPRGIAVNCNVNSLYYGRVFVGNASTSSNMAGIFKFNADGSAADEGSFSTGGYLWRGGWRSPWKMQVTTDDKLYVADFVMDGWRAGLVMAFDQLVSTNNYLEVLRQDNWPSNEPFLYSGPCITCSGTNRYILMADVTRVTSGGDPGIFRWMMNSNGVVASNETAIKIVAAGSGSDLNIAPYDVDVDSSGNIYTIQQIGTPGDPSFRVFRFSPGEEEMPLTTADWKVGSGDDLLGNASGIAVNPSGTRVAVSLQGVGTVGLEYGGIEVFDAQTGAFETNIVDFLHHQHTDVAWDNVGNLYALDLSDHKWRVFSPPGSNQATTVSVPIIQIVPDIQVPTLAACHQNEADSITFSILGQSNATYLVQSSTNLIDWSVIQTNYSTAAVRPVTVQKSDLNEFFRVLLQTDQ